MLKLQYLGHLIRRGDSLKMALILGKIEGREESGRDGWMASLTPWTWVWANSRRWWRAGKPGVLQSMGMRRVRRNSVTEHQRSQRGCDVWALARKWRKWSLENIWGRQFGVTQTFFKIFIGVYNWFKMCLLCTAKWISYTYTQSQSFLDSFPIWVIAGYWVDIPVLSITKNFNVPIL